MGQRSIERMDRIRQVWAASDWLSSSGSPATGRVMWAKSKNVGGWDFGSYYPYQAETAGCWFSFCDRVTAELHKIAAIGTGTLTFDDPLTIAFRQSGGHNAQVYRIMGNQSGTDASLVSPERRSGEHLALAFANGGLKCCSAPTAGSRTSRSATGTAAE